MPAVMIGAPGNWLAFRFHSAASGRINFAQAPAAKRQNDQS
jgi:hypothetical protein